MHWFCATVTVYRHIGIANATATSICTIDIYQLQYTNGWHFQCENVYLCEHLTVVFSKPGTEEEACIYVTYDFSMTKQQRYGQI